MNNPPVLTILIPTLECRAHFLRDLLTAIDVQLTSDVEVITLLDNGEQSVGEKRNRLVEMAVASGADYSVFVDDDDAIASDYVASILDAAKQRPDTITFNVRRFENGQTVGHQLCSLKHPPGFSVQNPGTPFITWLCSPIHINPVRTELARQVKFPPINAGEDTAWQVELYPLLKSEVHIVAYLYDYRYVSPDRRGHGVSNTSGWILVEE